MSLDKMGCESWEKNQQQPLVVLELLWLTEDAAKIVKTAQIPSASL